MVKNKTSNYSFGVSRDEHLDRRTGLNRNRIEPLGSGPGRYSYGFLKPGTGRTRPGRTDKNRQNRQKTEPFVVIYR